MPINFGIAGIEDIKFGNNQIAKVYQGNDLVWQNVKPVTLNLTKINNFTEVSNSYGDGYPDHLGNPTRIYWYQWAHFQNVIVTATSTKAMISIDGGYDWIKLPSFTTEAEKCLGLYDLQKSGRSICYGNGLWINVGDYGRCMRSTDGITWTKQEGLNNASGFMSNNNMFQKVIHNGSYFLAVGTNIVAKSTDGITWEARLIGGSSGGSHPDSVMDLTIFWDVVWDGQKFVAVGSGDAYQTNRAISFYSSDGLTWTESNLHTLYSGIWSEFRSISWNGSVFVAMGNDVLAKSTDGITWSSTAVGKSHSSADLANNNNYFIAPYNSQLFSISQTGDNPWYDAVNDVPWSRWLTSYYKGSEFMIVGGDRNFVPELYMSTNSADVDTF
jgi:hypothetical protein